MNKLEKFQLESTPRLKIQFIKSYPILNKLNITPNQKNLIELVLSYQDNNLEFFMNYGDIADLLNTRKQSITNDVSQLKKLGYINPTNSKNFNGKNGGSSTVIVVNLDNIIKNISNPEEAPKEKKVMEVKKISLDTTPTQDTELDLYDYLPNTRGVNIEDTMDIVYAIGNSKVMESDFTRFLIKNPKYIDLLKKCKVITTPCGDN